MKDRFLKEVEFEREDGQVTGNLIFKRVKLEDGEDVSNAEHDTEIIADLHELIKEPTWYEDPDALNS